MRTRRRGFRPVTEDNSRENRVETKGREVV